MRIFKMLRKWRSADQKQDSREKIRTSSSPSIKQPYRLHDRISGRYEIYRILGGAGKSGMGIVYVCYDHNEKSVLVLKTFQDKYTMSKDFRDGFRREALLWIVLDRHPHIVRAYWVADLDYRLFVACEYVPPDGEGRNTLSHHLERRIRLKEILTWTIQFCYGMQFAFSKGVSPHRDIKPDNIMITRDGVLRITDFGLAGSWRDVVSAAELRDETQGEREDLSILKTAENKIVCGTPPWMAPEQFDGEADMRSDIYGFGIVLYQMAHAGRLPFVPGPADNWETAHKMYPVQFEHQPSNSVGLESLFPIILKCLQKKPEDRYSDFEKLREDCEELFKLNVTKKGGGEVPMMPAAAELDSSEYNNKGISLAELGFNDDAITSLREALRIDPGNTAALINLGNTELDGKGNHMEAIQAFQQAIRIRSDDADAHNGLGMAFQHEGVLDKAIDEFHKAIAIRPEMISAYINLGNVLQDKGDFDPAIHQYRKALSIQPKSAIAHHNLGNALKAKGYVDEAIREYRESLSLRPQNAGVHLSLGTALYERGILDEAISEWDEAIKIDPHKAEAHNNLANILAQQGNRKEAIREYRKVISIQPEYASAHYNLGHILREQGNIREAIEAYENFIRYAPAKHARHVATAKELIDSIRSRM